MLCLLVLYVISTAKIHLKDRKKKYCSGTNRVVRTQFLKRRTFFCSVNNRKTSSSYADTRLAQCFGRGRH